MVCDVIGFQRVEYDKKDGSGHVSGVNLFLSVPFKKDEGVGVNVIKEFVKPDLFPIGSDLGSYDVEYTKNPFNGLAYIANITRL